MGNKYEHLCKSAGLKMVGCGTNGHPSQNYPTRAVAMPSSWSCNMMSALQSKTGLCTDFNCLALQEYPDAGAYMYTNGPNGAQQSSGSTTYHPICGCEIGYDHGCDTKTLPRPIMVPCPIRAFVSIGRIGTQYDT